MSQPTADPSEGAPKELRFRYRLVHVVYIFTLLASSLATFGSGGLLPGVFLCAFWAAIFTSRSRPRAFAEGCLILLVCTCLFGIFLPAFSSAREAARRMSCANNLKQIGLALHDYHDIYGSFPPAYVPDENGKPMHSWRVLLLPFVEHQPLYDAYDFDEPWNGPNNSKLLKQMPWVYACPSAGRDAGRPKTRTDYVVIVGPTTAWPGATAGTLEAITDGVANTVLVTELGGQNIPWLEPRDVELGAALDLLVAGESDFDGHHRQENFFYHYFTGRNVTLADGGIQFVSHGVDRKVWAALLGREDRVSWTDDDVEVPLVIVKRLKTGNCLRFALFVLLTLFPLPWVWLNPTRK